MNKSSVKNILFYFSSTIIGGAETNILKISRELSKLNHKVFWCYLVDDGPLLQNVDFEVAGILETGLFYNNPIGFYKKYRNFVRANKIDVIFNFGLRVEIISRLLSKRFGVKKIISNIRSTDDWRMWYHTFLDRLTQSSVDVWVSNSLAGKKAFHKRERIDEHKIHVIYNFHEDTGDIDTITTTNKETFTIGILANITIEKGYFDLIPLAKKLGNQGLSYKFIYAGHDKLNGEFEAKILLNNLNDKFVYLGYIKNKAEFFSKIDLFILPSYLEGMPTVILEALANKKPVISTTVGGIPEIINNGVNGFLCCPGDIDCLAKSIVKVRSGKYFSFIQEGQLKLKEFSKKTIMDKWVELLAANE